ncbi:MAG: hypothetical protein U0746_17820 [Gemmataceae bacterium]
MIESPILMELIAEREAMAHHKSLHTILTTRFGPLPAGTAGRLEVVTQPNELDDLTRWAVVCPDLDAFLNRLPTRSP